MSENTENTGLEMEKSVVDLVENEEKMLWRGRAKQNAYLSCALLNAVLPLILWLAIEGFVIGFVAVKGIFGDFNKIFALLITGAFLLHLIPIALWIKEVLSSNLRISAYEYAITDKRIIVMKSNVISDSASVELDKVNEMKFHRSFGAMLVGCGNYTFKCDDGEISFSCLENGYEQFAKIKKAVGK